MKTLLFVVLTIIPLYVNAQKYTVRRYPDEKLPPSVTFERDSIIQSLKLTSGGAYERKEEVFVDSVLASELYVRCMETVSDWAGKNERIEADLEFNDKESGTIIYKGRFSLGFKNVFLGDGWNRYGDFILKISCKDRGAEIVLNVPTITAIYNRSGLKTTRTIEEIVNGLCEFKGKKREREKALLEDMVETSNNILQEMVNRMKSSNP